MDINNFIEHFAEQFDDTPISEFTPTTVFRDLEEYSSMIALSIMAMVKMEYDVILKGDDIRNAVTIGDLFDTVSRQKA